METRDIERTSGQAGESGPSSSASIEGTLWSSILASTDRRNAQGLNGGTDSRHGSRRLIVLGSHDSGKSTVIKALARPNNTSGDVSVGNRISSRPDKGKTVEKQGPQMPDMGINFQYIDLADDAEGEEDPTSRLSVYQMPSTSNMLHASLLPLGLTQESLLNSVILIVLDWEKPWTFLRELRRWLLTATSIIAAIEDPPDAPKQSAVTAAPDNRRRKGKYVVEEGRDLLETYLRSYQEPTQGDSGSTSATALPHYAAATAGDRPPLPEGTLSLNTGSNIIVICNKSDHIQTLERSAHLTEDMVEHVQQVLRTICLQYGAALFFTSQYHPTTFTRLRSYILHRLHAAASLQSLSAANASEQASISAAAAAASTRHPFPYRANAVDREKLCIPTGWDSYGKIRVMREGFDCAATAKGWMLDVGAIAAEGDDDGPDGPPILSATASYEAAIVDVEAQLAATTSRNVLLEVQDEQDFLKAHHEMLAREAAKQRQHQQLQAQAQAQAQGPQAGSARSGSSLDGHKDITDIAKKFLSSAGVVGPMSSSSLSLPTVERALDREASTSATENASLKAPSTSRRDSSRPTSSLSNGQILSPSLGSQPMSPPLPSSPSPSAGSQNEVLANFFQSLLKTNSGKGSTGPSSGSAGKTSNRSSVDYSKIEIKEKR